MTLMEDVAALQDRIAMAQKARARAEGARESAQASLDKALADLTHHFGVTGEQQAQELLAQLKAELEQITAAITAKLDEIGA